jgi:xanthine dehydrogenase accessory factor
MICGGRVTLYYEYIPVIPTVYLFGAGHVGTALVNLLKALDYKTILIEDKVDAESHLPVHQIRTGNCQEVVRAEKIPADSYVVIAGYSHEVDFDVLKAIYQAGWRPRYIGLLASTRKVRSFIPRLLEEVGEHIDLGILYSPAGLDIGGSSPQEIALSILCEVQSIRYERAGNRHLRELWYTS